MKQEIPIEILREIERRGETIQLGVAASCAAGILAVLSMDSRDSCLWWATILFSVGLPSGLSRTFMSFTANTAGIFLSPVSWMMYPLGILSCLSALAGYTLLCFHISYYHGLILLIWTGIGFIWLKVHARAVRQKIIHNASQQRQKIDRQAS
jgi:hypothetical protein